MAHSDAVAIVRPMFADRSLLNRASTTHAASVTQAARNNLPDLSISTVCAEPAFDGWTAHIGVRAPGGVDIHPNFADQILEKLAGRHAFAELGSSSVELFFAVEENSVAVRRRVGQFAIGVVHLLGDVGQLETLRLLKVNQQWSPLEPSWRIDGN